MVSIKEVARIAEVSIATVSRYINNPDVVKEATRVRVQKAISETGYAPNTLARNFRLGKTGIIFVILPSIGDPFFTEVMDGITDVAKKMNISIVIKEASTHKMSSVEYTNMIFSKQTDGIILLASINPFSSTDIQQESNKNQPIVIGCESVSPELNQFPSVRIDNVAAAQEATQHLITLGHTKIGFIYGSDSSALTQDRENGFRQQMKIAGLPVEDHWLVEGNLSISGAQKATLKLLALPHAPTAIFCANDEMALGCIYQIKNQNLRVPQDISVIGFDDIRYADISDPPLTTIAQPTRKIGERSILRLLKLIDGKDIGTEPEIVPHTLVLRGSTGPAPQ